RSSHEMDARDDDEDWPHVRVLPQCGACCRKFEPGKRIIYSKPAPFSSRALGQCQIGVDPVAQSTNPSSLCYAHSPCEQPGSRRSRYGVFVAFCKAEIHEHYGVEATSWMCCPMKGTLQVW